MKFDSPLFDRIRVKPDQDRRLRAMSPACDWPGCEEAGSHRAPKGRDKEREYWRFCLAHVREYNQSYNYFAGMSVDAMAQYQKDSIVGHRPTWKLGQNASPSAERSSTARFYRGPRAPDDPFGVFREHGRTRPRPETPAEPRATRNAERRALDVMGLESDAKTPDVKARFKALVKRHHPDANGGDRSSEDRLREIIQAYNYLKSVGYR